MITEVRRQFGVRRRSGSEDVHLQRRKEADPTPRGTSRRRTEHGSLGMNQHLYGYTPPPSPMHANPPEIFVDHHSLRNTILVPPTSSLHTRRDFFSQFFRTKSTGIEGTVSTHGFCRRLQGADSKDLARINFNPPLPAVRTEFARWLRTSRAPRWKGLPSPRARACSQSTLSFRSATSSATTQRFPDDMSIVAEEEEGYQRDMIGMNAPHHSPTTAPHTT
jgi:hypothetical protein